MLADYKTEGPLVITLHFKLKTAQLLLTLSVNRSNRGSTTHPACDVVPTSQLGLI